MFTVKKEKCFNTQLVLHGGILLEKHEDAWCGLLPSAETRKFCACWVGYVLHSLFTNGKSIWGLFGGFPAFPLQGTHGEHVQGSGPFFLMVFCCAGVLLSETRLFVNRVEHWRELLFLDSKAKELKQTSENDQGMAVSDLGKGSEGGFWLGQGRFSPSQSPNKTSLETLFTILDTSSSVFYLRR